MDDWAGGLTIDDLLALPEDWATKSLDKLNGGHLIRLMFGINAPIQTELKMLTEKITDLQNVNIILSNKLDYNAGEIKELHNEVIQEGEITSLKKTIFNQQIFLESIQKKELRNNLMVSGVLNGNLTFKGVEYSNSYEKVNTVFEELVPGIDHNAYKITVFPSAEGRNTHICKVIFDDYDTKMAISNNTSKLRDIEAFSSDGMNLDTPDWRIVVFELEDITYQENSQMMISK